MRDIKHVAVMLQDIRDFGTFHRVHMHFFPNDPPALVVTGFNEVGHRGTLIEIEPTAVDPRANLDVTELPWPVCRAVRWSGGDQDRAGHVLRRDLGA